MIITRIWDRQPGQYFFISTKKGRGTWHDQNFPRKDLHKVARYIEQHRDCDVYFCPHGFSRPQRHKDYVIQPRLLWSDMDAVDPRKVKWRPTIAFESSPGRHVGLWVTDEQMTDSLNQRLTYAIGADVSGWDFTQVLRVPGTINYKYASLPRTRILWSDGPTYSIDELAEQLPRVSSKSTYDTSDAAEVYRKWEKKLPSWLRRELSSKKEPPEGTRSEVVMKMAHTMHENGMSREEGLTLLAASVWNKYRGRKDESRQLNRTWDKAINKSLSGERVRAIDNREHDYAWISKSLADTEEENIDWLWYPYLARGQITILEGDPGLGKSYLAQMVAGHIMDGKKMPSIRKMKTSPKPEPVIYFDLENSAGSVTKKRIKWNGFSHHENFYQEERPFSIDDVETMEAIFERIGQVKPAIVFFDTLNTYIGKADAFKGHEVQQALINFRALAQQFNCSVVLVRHLTKGARDRELLYRGQGSMSIVGMARLAIQLGKMPDDPDVKVFGMIKNQFGKFPPPMTFTVDELPDTLKEWDRSKFSWGEYQKGKTLEELLTAKAEEDGNAIDNAKDFVREQLADGAVVKDKALREAAERVSIRARVLSRALEAVGAVKKGASWSMP